MSELYNQLSNLDISGSVDKLQIVKEINDCLVDNGYTVVEINDQKPWGAYFRLDNGNADAFVGELFPNLSPTEARLGNEEAELSPKILLVSPKQRLSWQYHNRRAERWVFLTDGAYNQSLDNDEGDVLTIKAGEDAQFVAQERHRLVGCLAMYTLVAEIWQHSDSTNPSDEADIIRLKDDYNRG